MNGELDRAREAFAAARLAAEAIGSRRLLWQILAALAGIEPDLQKAAAYKAQARDAVQFIADHIANAEFRSLFTQSEGVSAILA